MGVLAYLWVAGCFLGSLGVALVSGSLVAWVLCGLLVCGVACDADSLWSWLSVVCGLIVSGGLCGLIVSGGFVLAGIVLCGWLILGWYECATCGFWVSVGLV